MNRLFCFSIVFSVLFLTFQVRASGGCYLQSYVNHSCFRFSGSGVNGLEIGPCNPKDAYTLQESSKQKGYYFIVMHNLVSKKCVHQLFEIRNWQGIGNITPSECVEDHDNTLWKIVPDDWGYFFNSGYFYLQAKHSGKCLGINPSTGHGPLFRNYGLLIQRDCDTSASLWQFVRPQAPDVPVNSIEACLD